MVDPRKMSDARLEQLRLDLCQKGDLLGCRDPSLAAVRGRLRWIAREQTRRADEARQRAGDTVYLQAA